MKQAMIRGRDTENISTNFVIEVTKPQSLINAVKEVTIFKVFENF